MKTKLLCYLIISCMMTFFLSLTACNRSRDQLTENTLPLTAKYLEPNSLKETWSKIDKKNIRRIILLRGLEILTDNEPIEIPQECLEGYIELLDNAIRKFKIKDTLDVERTLQIKIITDKNIFFIPGEWMLNSKSIDSKTYYELWNYLMGCDVWKPGFQGIYDTTGWTKLHSPRKDWSKLKKENIRRIIFCEGDEELKVDDWVVDFEVPNNCLKGAIRLLDKSMREQKKISRMPDAWMGFSGMKIITDKKKYLVPAGWTRDKWSRNNKMITGVDWTSSELREYLVKCGWQDLIEPIHDFNQPLQKRSE